MHLNALPWKKKKKKIVKKEGMEMNMHKSDRKAENNNTERYSLLPSFSPFIEPFSVENEVSQRERKPQHIHQ